MIASKFLTSLLKILDCANSYIKLLVVSFLKAVDNRLNTIILSRSSIEMCCPGEPDNDRDPAAELQEPVSARDAGAAGRGEMCKQNPTGPARRATGYYQLFTSFNFIFV